MYDKGSEKPIGCMGSKSDKRNQQPDFQNGAIVQVKKHIYMYKEKNTYTYWGYETKQTIVIYQIQVHNTMTCYMKYEVLWYDNIHK